MDSFLTCLNSHLASATQSVPKSVCDTLGIKGINQGSEKSSGRRAWEYSCICIPGVGEEWAGKEVVCKYSGRHSTRLMAELIGYGNSQICSKCRSLRAKEKDHTLISSNSLQE